MEPGAHVPEDEVSVGSEYCITLQCGLLSGGQLEPGVHVPEDEVAVGSCIVQHYNVLYCQVDNQS